MKNKPDLCQIVAKQAWLQSSAPATCTLHARLICPPPALQTDLSEVRSADTLVSKRSAGTLA